jgi:hypothetical protein
MAGEGSFGVSVLARLAAAGRVLDASHNDVAPYKRGHTGRPTARNNVSLETERTTQAILRVAIVVASVVALAGGIVTLYVIAAHDPDDGANIGGGVGVIGTGLAIAAVLVTLSARGRSRGPQVAAAIGGALLLLVSLSFLSLIRPFD